MAEKETNPGSNEGTIPKIGLLDNLEDLTIDDLELFKKRMIEDDRMDSIFRSKQNLNEKFDNRAYLHPHGMTEFDYKSIPENRRDPFEKFKHKIRHENYQYLGEHYELDAMIEIFLKKLLTVKPQDAVHFAAQYFTSDILTPSFEGVLDNEKRKLSNYRVCKMKAAQKITTTVVHEMKKSENKEVKTYERCFKKNKDKHCVDKNAETVPESTEIAIKPQDDNLNWLKKLNIGPLAQDFDTRVILPPPVVETKEPVYKKRVKKIYCGCKDPGRRLISHPEKAVETPPSEDENDDNDSTESDDDYDDDDDDDKDENAHIRQVYKKSVHPGMRIPKT